MNTIQTADELDNVAQELMKRIELKGGQFGPNFDLVVAITYHAAKVNELIQTIQGIASDLPDMIKEVKQ